MKARQDYAAHPGDSESRMVVKLSGFSFDTEATKLHYGDRQVPLQLQPARVLGYLIEHRDGSVTRQELVRHVWPDTHVNFSQSLNYCVRRIRVALHEDTTSHFGPISDSDLR